MDPVIDKFAHYSVESVAEMWVREWSSLFILWLRSKCQYLSINPFPACCRWTQAILMVTILQARACLKPNCKPNQVEFYGFRHLQGQRWCKRRDLISGTSMLWGLQSVTIVYFLIGSLTMCGLFPYLSDFQWHVRHLKWVWTDTPKLRDQWRGQLGII